MRTGAKIRFVQDGTVPANGQDHVSTLQTLLQRQINDPCRAATFPQGIAHQYSCAVGQQDLRRTKRDFAGRGLARIGRNVDRHTGFSFADS